MSTSHTSNRLKFLIQLPYLKVRLCVWYSPGDQLGSPKDSLPLDRLSEVIDVGRLYIR